MVLRMEVSHFDVVESLLKLLNVLVFVLKVLMITGKVYHAFFVFIPDTSTCMIQFTSIYRMLCMMYSLVSSRIWT